MSSKQAFSAPFVHPNELVGWLVGWLVGVYYCNMIIPSIGVSDSISNLQKGVGVSSVGRGDR